MTKYTLLKGMGLIMAVGMMAGCATAPTQEMSDARQAVQAARAVGAAQHTPVAMESAEKDLTQAETKLRKRDYDSARDDALAAKQQAVRARNMALAISEAKEEVAKAEAMGAVTQMTRDWLTQAEAASAVGNEKEVLRTAQRAKQEAQDDMRRFREEQLRVERENRALLDKVTPLLHEAHQAGDRLSDEQLATLREAEEAYREKQGRKAYELVNPVVEAARALPPLKQLQQYKVAAGDTLWRIAARQAVYGNPWWWPLIYLSNQDKLPDPQGLNAGMVLDIDMNPGADLVDLALQYAHRRQRAKGNLKALDRQFLRDANKLISSDQRGR